MSFFRRRRWGMMFFKGRKWGALLLGVWLLIWGLLPLLHVEVSWRDTALRVLAVAAGILIVLDR